MERDDARGDEATAGLDREREQRGHERGGEEHATSADAERTRRESVERHQAENPTDFAARDRDDQGREDVEAP